MLLHPVELRKQMKSEPDYYHWNNELIFAYHLTRKGLFEKVKRFPYVMYMAREVNDESATWSRGYYEPRVGHYVKYKKEFRTAYSYATIIRTPADWEARNWMQFDPTKVTSAPIPLHRWLRYGCESLYFWVHSALKRPGRLGRLIRFFKRTLSINSGSDLS
jgi:hypothetical protein